jgi:SRSO17 transposase
VVDSNHAEMTRGPRDEYYAAYCDSFEDVRSFEHLCPLHLGRISDLPCRSLPAIGQRVVVGSQPFHHFIANAEWSPDEVQPGTSR